MGFSMLKLDFKSVADIIFGQFCIKQFIIGDTYINTLGSLLHID